MLRTKRAVRTFRQRAIPLTHQRFGRRRDGDIVLNELDCCPWNLPSTGDGRDRRGTMILEIQPREGSETCLGKQGPSESGTFRKVATTRLRGLRVEARTQGPEKGQESDSDTGKLSPAVHERTPSEVINSGPFEVRTRSFIKEIERSDVKTRTNPRRGPYWAWTAQTDRGTSRAEIPQTGLSKSRAHDGIASLVVSLSWGVASRSGTLAFCRIHSSHDMIRRRSIRFIPARRTSLCLPAPSSPGRS